MTADEQKSIQQMALGIHGIFNQQWMLVEECGELLSTLRIDKDAKLEMDWSPSPIKQTYTVKIEDKHPLLEDFLSGMSFNVDTTIFQKMDHQKLPRKVKKAFTSYYYRRNTKWKRELSKYILRSRHHLGSGEMKVTEDEMGNIKAVIECGRNAATSVNVDADTLIKALKEKQKNKTMKPRDIKRLEKCVAYYGMIVALLGKCEDSIDFEDKFMSDVIRQMSDSARADKVFLEGKIKAVKEEWK